MIYNQANNSLYVLEKLIGIGGSSNIFLSTHLQNKNKVAIKLLKKDKCFDKHKEIKILQNEHRKMMTVEAHPNILKTLESCVTHQFEDDGTLSEVIFNIIQFAENGSLAYFIRKSGGLGEDIAKFYLIQIWHAIAYVHSLEIAHMDIKLDNILLDEFFNVKLADFGVSVDVSATGGFADWFWGTAGYMAPEVAHLLPTETYDAYKADIYSLGMWLYVMLFGEFPIKENYDTWSVDDSEIIGWVTGLKCSIQTKKLWWWASDELQELIGNMLSMDPDERPTIDEILQSEWLNSINNQVLAHEVQSNWILNKIKNLKNK